jgi:5'-phosphate synthase pdxT subunit
VSGKPTIGIIALQGDFAAHERAFRRAGAQTRLVSSPDGIAGAEGLVIPGGESTTMTLLGYANGLWPAVREAAQAGTPVMGTCAGIIMLARALHQESAKITPLKLLDITLARNAYGSQVDSFEGDVRLRLTGEECTVVGVFIRAPAIIGLEEPTEAVGWLGDEVVAVRKGNVFGLTFHPELTGDLTILRHFVGLASR